MKLIKELPRIAARVLHNHRTIRSDMKEKFELISIAYGDSSVVRDFEDWCVSQKDANLKHPIYEYLKVIDSRLGSIPEEQRPDIKDPRVTELVSLSYELTSILPPATAVAELLLRYSFDEIKDALAEYTANLTESDVKGALRAFYQSGGAGAIILARRRRLEKTKGTK